MDCDRRTMLTALVGAGIGSGVGAGGTSARAMAAAAPPAATAWSAFSARFLQPDGRIIDTGNGNISHSEGQGYGLLLAEVAGDRAAFERIWHWTSTTLTRPDVRLFSWRYDPSSATPISDPNNATDGDLLIAWALLRAAQRWKVPGYAAQSAEIRQAIRQHLIRPHGAAVLLAPGLEGFSGAGAMTVNPSYYVWPALQAFAPLDQGSWRMVIQSGTQLLAAASFGRYRLPSDWVDVFDDGHVTPAHDKPARFGYDAIRVPLYLALAGRKEGLNRFSAFWGSYLRAGKPIPAWIDLLTEEQAGYGLSSGGLAVVDVVAGNPPRRIAGDYYSSALGALACLAA